MLMVDPSWANFYSNVLDHKNVQNVCFYMNGSQMDPMQVLVFTIDLGHLK